MVHDLVLIQLIFNLKLPSGLQLCSRDEQVAALEQIQRVFGVLVPGTDLIIVQRMVSGGPPFSGPPIQPAFTDAHAHVSAQRAYSS